MSSNEYEMQETERPGEKEDLERRKREREEWERRVRERTLAEYGEKITLAAAQAKDYVSDKVSVIGDKMKELQNADLGEVAENAKDYARTNPGKAILISAAAGLIVGLLIGRRRY